MYYVVVDYTDSASSKSLTAQAQYPPSCWLGWHSVNYFILKKYKTNDKSKKKINLILFENCVSAYWLTKRISAKIVIDHMDIKNHSLTLKEQPSEISAWVCSLIQLQYFENLNLRLKLFVSIVFDMQIANFVI